MICLSLCSETSCMTKKVMLNLDSGDILRSPSKQVNACLNKKKRCWKWVHLFIIITASCPKTAKTRLKMLVFRGISTLKYAEFTKMCDSVFLQEKKTSETSDKTRKSSAHRSGEWWGIVIRSMTLTFLLHEVACLRVKYVTGSFAIVAYYIGVLV